MKKLIPGIFVFLILSAVTAVYTAAAGIEFSVSPVLPENQRPGVLGYFDLTLSPGETQDIAVTVKNTGDKEITVTTDVFTAATNRNGIIDYTMPGESDDTLIASFADIARVEEDTATIPAHSEKDITVTVTMPDKRFDGVLLGSIRVIKELSDEEKASGGAILNRYSYVTAIKLQQNDSPIEPDFLLGDINAELFNGRATILVNFRNPMPRLTKAVTVSATIYPQSGGDAVFDYTMASVDFAPNSVFPCSLVDKEGYGIRAGTYIARLRLEYEGWSWDFEQDFEIKPEEAANINENAVNQNRQGRLSELPPVWVIVVASVAGLAVIAIIVLLIVIARRGKGKKHGEDKK